jgi:hypothetical protein
MAALFWVGYLHVTGASHGTDAVDMTYDKLKDRYNRIRAQSIEYLKNSQLTDDQIKLAIADIRRIDEIQKHVRDYESLARKISDLIYPANRNSKIDIRQQQLIEDLAHNDLFLKSAEFKVL